MSSDLFLGYIWVTKDCRLMVNQALIGALRRTKSHISSELGTVMRSAASASMNSYKSGPLKIFLNQIRVVNLKLKNLRGCRAFGSNSSGLFALAQQIAGGPSRAAGLGPCFWKTFCGE